MEPILPLLTFVVGLAVGVAAVWMFGKDRIARPYETEKRDRDVEIARLETKLELESQQSQEKIELLQKAESKLSDAFKSLAADALRTNNDSFLNLATTKFEPIEKSIEKGSSRIYERAA